MFISGPDAESSRYRCSHQREQLDRVGLAVDVAYYGELDLAGALDRYACFVLYRLPWDRTVERFLAAARDRGMPVFADIDDLVFDPERAHLVQAAGARPARERRRYVDGMRLLRRTLGEVDGVLVSTDPLREAAREVNDRVAVTYNTVSSEMVAGAEAARAVVPGRREGVVLAYLSGTPTHDLDFREAADAVLWALEHYEEVRFLAAGFLSLDGRFDRFGERVERAPYRPWRELPSLLARVDVNLAPLQRENPFTECKSCVKYLEAALLGVPTVASGRADFVRVVRDGENGLLADEPGQWREAIAGLVESLETRERVGRLAHEDVRRSHTTAARAKEPAGALKALGFDAPS